MVDKKEYLLPSDIVRKRLIKVQVRTNPNYGKPPGERSVMELLSSGFINLDKPCGPTSHQVDAWVKEILGVDKVGHGGTLDPNATGVLPIAVGEATKVLQVLLLAGKEYVGVMRLHKDVDEKKIISVCKGFVGEIYQIPPLRSAVKRVRRKRRIYYLEVIQIIGRDVLFRVGCESGTYIRTLCVDIGKKLKSGAHLSELRRTRVGHLKEDDSVILQDVKDAVVFWKEEDDESFIREIIHPMEYMLDHLPKIIIRDSAVDALCHGANLALPGVVEVDSDIKKGDLVAVLTLKGEGVALMSTLMSTEEIIQKDKGICASPERVLMKKGTYPSIWKKT
ncbi:MAG: RNA-guided pseudouridylation complex pseudouridine synthase subunit Cbf5 [Thermoplasmata archaeon]|nr:MAG: RNA-guided pseudouridylation complex pseudouridine synthase subunit Cbf5 [Thermoplasmata archaeon]